MIIFRYNRLVGRRHRHVWRWIAVPLIVLTFAVAGLFLRARSFDSELQPSLAADVAIAVVLPNGTRTTLGDLIRSGRPTVISLWATWCGPCRREAPDIAKFTHRAQGRINILYLNVRDQDAGPNDIAAVLVEAGIPANAYARMDDSQIAALTGAGDVMIPRTLVFDGAGRPLARITGLKPLAFDRIAGLVGL